MKILIYTINIILSLIGIPLIFNMLTESKHLEKNYKGELIPISMGIVFLLVQLVSFSLAYYLYKDRIILVYLLAIVSIGFVGMLDDFIGAKDIKGFKGHIGSFFEGRLTTGLIKAGVGFYMSLFVAIYLYDGWADIILTSFLIALSINLLNLFDLRPGRAIKVYGFLLVILLILNVGREYNFIAFSLFIILFIYFPKDIKAKAMMGDVGSNILGMTIGFSFATIGSFYLRLFYTIVLALIHILAEKVSISKLIEKNKFLNYIDYLGR